MSIVKPHPQLCPECGLSDRVVMARTRSDRVSRPILHLGQPRVYESPWGGCSIVFITLSFVAFLFFLVIFIWYASVSAKAASDVAPEFTVTLILAIIAGFVIMHHAQKAKTNRAEVARYNAALQIENEAARKRFKADERIYEEDLFYCEHDDVVWIRDKPTTCIPASQIAHLYGAKFLRL